MLVIVGAGVAGAYYFASAGEKEPVVVVAEPVAKGEVIERADLTTASVAGLDGAVPGGDLDSLVGQTAAVDLVDGAVVTQGLVTDQVVPAPGQALVGLALEPSQGPATGLEPGDVVDVVAVPAIEGSTTETKELDSPEVLASGASVYAVEGAATAGGQVLVTVVVDQDVSAQLTAYASAGRVAVLETSTGGGG